MKWYGKVRDGYGVSVGSLGMVLDFVLYAYFCLSLFVSATYSRVGGGCIHIERGSLHFTVVSSVFRGGLLVTTQTSYTFTYIDCLELQYTRLPPPMFPSGVTVVEFRRLMSLPSATSPPVRVKWL